MVTSAKAALRAVLRRARRSLPPEAAAAEAARAVAALATWLVAAPAIASYLAQPGELDLGDLHDRWWGSGRPVWFPSVRGERLDWHPVTGLDQVRPGAFGVREPDPLRVAPAALPSGTVILVPGVGFGGDGRRLGQGGGYYDRVLADHDGPAIGVGFACQRCDDLPIDPHDRHLAGVLLGGEWLRRP